MKQLQAIIFDVDGTLANTERDGHRIAFNLAFEEFGLDWVWDINLYGQLLAVTGGKERIKAYIKRFNKKLTDDVDDFVVNLHQLKTKNYLKLLNTGEIKLRSGVKELLNSARKNNITLAIATTTTPENVHHLLANQLGDQSLDWFTVIGAGDIVANKKPAADIYDFVLAKLNIPTDNCIALEDSHNGLLSATGANLRTVITVNSYTENENFTGADLVVNKIGSDNNHFTVLAGNNHNFDYLSLDLLDSILVNKQ